MPDHTKPLPAPMLTYNQRCSVTFTISQACSVHAIINNMCSDITKQSSHLSEANELRKWKVYNGIWATKHSKPKLYVYFMCYTFSFHHQGIKSISTKSLCTCPKVTMTWSRDALRDVIIRTFDREIGERKFFAKRFWSPFVCPIYDVINNVYAVVTNCLYTSIRKLFWSWARNSLNQNKTRVSP